MLRGRNPDILTCIANLSSDEVFTPPELANQMLDALADAWAAHNDGANIWADKNVTFLDPCTKSGVFLREITRRLTEGLKDAIPVLEQRVDHILTKQVFGIAITQITSLLARRSLYCSKHANGDHSIAKSFGDESGNIWFERTKHTWDGAKCKFCSAPKAILDRAEGIENYAYPFIHSDDINTWTAKKFGGNMQFDVVIGNPPYQMKGGAGGSSDSSIYHLFVEQAKNLQPKFLSMVIPSRWLAGGRGLDEFRKGMLSERHLRRLVDYTKMSTAFPGVDFEGGVGYFLWDLNYQGDCEYQLILGDQICAPALRKLDEYDIFVRDTRAVAILQKVQALVEPSITSLVSGDTPFGLATNFQDYREKPFKGSVSLYRTDSGKRMICHTSRDNIRKNTHLIPEWKLLFPEAYGERGAIPALVLGPAIVAPPDSVCTQTYLVAGPFKSQRETKSALSYSRTRLFRFLVSLRKVTQHALRSTYTWVPQQTWDREWTDKELYKKYKLTKDEIAFIESMIRPMEDDDE